MKNIDQFVDGMIQVIKQHKFAMQGVFASGNGPSFCYTIGASEKLNAEFICVANANIELLHNILNPFVYEMMESGKINTEVFSVGLLNGTNKDLRGQFVDVTDNVEINRSITVRICDFKDEQLIGLYGHSNVPSSFKIYQLFIADKNNILPNEPGYDKGFVQTIPPEDNV